MSSSSAATQTPAHINADNISTITGVKYMIQTDDATAVHMYNNNTIRLILPIDLPITGPLHASRHLPTIRNFVDATTGEIVSLLFSTTGERWEVLLLAVQLRKKKCYALFDLVVEGYHVGLRAILPDTSQDVYAVTGSGGGGGYLIQRIPYGDKFVEKEYRMVKGIVGGERPWIVDMEGGVAGGVGEVAPSSDELSVEVNEVY